jgi:recombination protein RecR
MQKNISEIEELVKLISKFPGLGPKSSRRIVLKLINNREELIKPLTNTLAQVYKNIVRCNICGNIKSSNSNCTLQACSYSDKSYKQICVVENIADMWVIESSGIYKGYYHILGGTLSPSDNKKTDNLFIPSLVERVKKNAINEVILATSATIEGQTTAHYIQDSLRDTKVKISKLAQGLPVGGEIEFLDDGTLFSAFKNRGPVTSQ